MNLFPFQAIKTVEFPPTSHRLKTALLLIFVVLATWIPAWRLPAQERKSFPPERDSSAEANNLLGLEFPNGWTYFSAEDGTHLEDVWNRHSTSDDDTEGVVICKGWPEGYIRTASKYSNFELTLEWKYPSDANGHSGILIHTGAKDRIWPDAIQVQLHGPETGQVFPNGTAKTDNTLLEQRDVSRAVNQWNQWNSCTITSREGKLTVVVNGTWKVGEVTGCSPASGSIALQSEGSEIHFRDLKIRPL